MILSARCAVKTPTTSISCFIISLPGGHGFRQLPVSMQFLRGLESGGKIPGKRPGAIGYRNGKHAQEIQATNYSS